MNIDLMYPAIPSFDELQQIASTNPDALEELRHYYCESFIQLVSSSRQHRLSCIQNKIDLELQRAKNPLAGVIAISNMMHDSVANLSSFGFRNSSQDDNTSRPTATIIPFIKRCSE